MHFSDSPGADEHTRFIPAAADFYRTGMRLLHEAGIPFLVGGARAFCCHTGINRHTKDFDILLREADLERALETAQRAGFAAELTFPHWLGKVWQGDEFIDLIFRAGNGLCPVDDFWLARGREHTVLGGRVPVCAPEEMILPKAFVAERERYDGADIAHLLHACAEDIDFHHLLRLFGEHWRLLLTHLILFGFIYPGHRPRIPAWIIADLTARLAQESTAEPGAENLCRGTLISREQYLHDLRFWAYKDARLQPEGPMTAGQIAAWTAAIANPPPDASLYAP
jgi:hypothetical protein